MPNGFSVPAYSYFRAAAGDIVLRETSTTRLIFRAELVDNAAQPEASVHGQFIHQRKHPGSKEWQNDQPFLLRELQGGESVNLQLDSETTRNLFMQLQGLYSLPIEWGLPAKREWITVHPDEVYIGIGQEKQALETLIGQDEELVLEHLADLLPDAIANIALKREHDRRCAALEEFGQHLRNDDWVEKRWQQFFRENTWIFGHNLIFQFLSTLQDEAHVGGTDLSGRGGQFADSLLYTEGAIRFTVVVDIKRPHAALVRNKTYRNSVHRVGDDLVSGVMQVQSYCRRWVTEGLHQEETRDLLREKNIFTYEPRGIVVVGHCGQLDTTAKRATFELFRRNLHNPDVITYDELYDRAHFTVHGTGENKRDSSIPKRFRD